MAAQVISRTENKFTVQITVPFNRSMLDFEETLQQELNAAGVLATQEGVRSQKGVTPKGVLVRISELAEANQEG
jgi:hypothetical protein